MRPSLAGVSPAHRVVNRKGEMFPLDVWRRAIDINLTGTFDVLRNVARAMAQNAPGEDGERGDSASEDCAGEALVVEHGDDGGGNCAGGGVCAWGEFDAVFSGADGGFAEAVPRYREVANDE